MIIDVNAFLGHYPFRRLERTTARQLIELMDAHSVDAALVSSIHSVFYRDSHQGNAELFEDIQPYAGRLFPVAAVNPKYAGWERDLEHSVQQGRAKAITLWPEHHGYSLGDEFGLAALSAINACRLPVVLTQRLEDRRQRHHWDVADDLSQASIIAAAAAFPDLRFHLCNWTGLNETQLLAAGLRGRCLVDFARLSMLMTKDAVRMMDTLQAESIAYGSHMPFDYPGPALVKLASVQALFPERYPQIAAQNATAFFRLELPASVR